MKRGIIVLLLFLLIVTSTSCNLNNTEIFQYANEEYEMFKTDGKFMDYNDICEYIKSKCDKNSNISFENISSSLRVLLITNEETKLYLEVHEFSSEMKAKSDFYDYCFKYTYHNYPYFITLKYSNYIINTIGKTGCLLIKNLFNLGNLQFEKINNNLDRHDSTGVLLHVENHLSYNDVVSFDDIKYSHRVFVENNNGTSNTAVIIRTDFYDISKLNKGFIYYYDDFVIFSSNQKLIDKVVKIIDEL